MASRRSVRKVTDPKVLKALSHPLRLRLYELLQARGPATATTLSAHVDEAVGLLSYHLRKLAEHGYVEEAPELGADGRERWWRSVPGGVSWSSADFLGDPGDRAVAAAAERVLLGRQLDRLREYKDAADAWGADWVDAALASDSLFLLTPDEMRRLSDELKEVILRWSDREVPADGQHREHAFMFTHLFPFRP